MDDFIGDFRHLVERSAEALLAISEADSARRPAPGKWSPKEIVGHLIDSASNNHQRFVRAPFKDDLIFPGYDQDAWVTTQRYQEAPWPALVELWRAFNLHLARVMAATPEAARLREHRQHNFPPDRLANRPGRRADDAGLLHARLRDPPPASPQPDLAGDLMRNLDRDTPCSPWCLRGNHSGQSIEHKILGSASYPAP